MGLTAVADIHRGKCAGAWRLAAPMLAGMRAQTRGNQHAQGLQQGTTSTQRERRAHTGAAAAALLLPIR